MTTTTEVETLEHTVGARVEYAYTMNGYRIWLDTREGEWPNAAAVMTPAEALALSAILADAAADAELRNVENDYANYNPERES